MSVGKIAAQCGHAVLGGYQLACEEKPELIEKWEEYGTKKIAVQCDSLEEIEALAA